MSLSFVLVENIELDQYIAKRLIKKVVGEAHVETFSTAQSALNHIVLDNVDRTHPRIILLDLMMPQMSGGDFINLFEALPEEVKNRYHIAIITSSMNKAEVKRLSERKDVAVTVEKPLTHEKFVYLLAQIDGAPKKGKK